MAEERSTGEGVASAPSIWGPFRELDLLRDLERFPGLGAPRIGRALDELLTGGATESGSGPLPAIDISEDDERYRITAELPGATAEDITVESDGNVLTIRGEKRCEREESRERARWSERSYGAFSRSFTLPADAARDRVDASFQDGVLGVEIPKTKETKSKVISIKAG